MRNIKSKEKTNFSFLLFVSIRSAVFFSLPIPLQLPSPVLSKVCPICSWSREQTATFAAAAVAPWTRDNHPAASSAMKSCKSAVFPIFFFSFFMSRRRKKSSRQSLSMLRSFSKREKGGWSESETSLVSFSLLFAIVGGFVFRWERQREGMKRCPHPDYYRLLARGKFSHSEDIISVGKFSEPIPRLGVMWDRVGICPLPLSLF